MVVTRPITRIVTTNADMRNVSTDAITIKMPTLHCRMPGDATDPSESNTNDDDEGGRERVESRVLTVRGWDLAFGFVGRQRRPLLSIASYINDEVTTGIGVKY